MTKRVVIVQYGGDYREAVQRFAKGGGETYQAQRYSVTAVAELTRRVASVTVICCMSSEPYNEVLSSGVRAIGAGFQERLNERRLLQLIEAERPTHLVVRTPIVAVFRWAIRHKVPVLVTLADSFAIGGLRNCWRNYKLAQLLNHERIEWVGNHGITASRLLQKIGVRPTKIIPWDFPPMVTPAGFVPKQLSSRHPHHLVFVGAMTQAKGMGDLLQAVAHLKAQGMDLQLTIAGTGSEEDTVRQAQKLGVAHQVECLGLVAHTMVVPLMRSADVVVIPSRHDYPEGFPLAINEALCAQTPLVVSDHPMFCEHLQHRVSAMVFAASDSMALAESVRTLLTAPELYANLSAMSRSTWEKLQISVKWADLLERWFDPAPENQRWIASHCLESNV